MERPGRVSLWMGSASSQRALDTALLITYSEDGDSEGSEFGRAFELGCYDEDFREGFARQRPAGSLSAMLEGVSYSSSVIPAFEAKGVTLEADDNCGVLLYDFEFNGAAGATRSIGGVRLRFAGCVSYEKMWIERPSAAATFPRDRASNSTLKRAIIARRSDSLKHPGSTGRGTPERSVGEFRTLGVLVLPDDGLIEGDAGDAPHVLEACRRRPAPWGSL